MSQSSKQSKSYRRLRVWQRFFLVVVILTLLFLSSTLFRDNNTVLEEYDDELQSAGEIWPEAVTAYVLAEDGKTMATFYNEAFAPEEDFGRGCEVTLENWTPFVAENGTEYYHACIDGQYGYFLCENITDDKSDILQESQVYVRTTTNLLTEPDGLTLGSLASKGELLRIVGYDYFTETGEVNMYEVKLGTEIGWIYASYVVETYVEAVENWTNEDDIYETHVLRGDLYGGGDAAGLDYWPREKGDFTGEGNVMPESCYGLYVPASDANPTKMAEYLALAEDTAVNTIVITVFDDGEVAYPSSVLEDYGLGDAYGCGNTWEEFSQAVSMAKDAGYYVVARITAFKDNQLAQLHPEWSITDLNGQLMSINASYWPSVFSRDVWQLKVELALEAVDKFGFQEIQFDYVRFPDYIAEYEETGTVDLKNTYGESKAQAVQRFLMYACDAIHEHGAYVAADVFGETSNTYVAPYGQYWDAISTVVDVISGMPYPDHYNSYYQDGEYYRPYKHPYATLSDWALHVRARQMECSSPAIVRTWIQTWDDADYSYDETAIMREIVALYDEDITGGYMPWLSYGSLSVADNLGSALDYDYYTLYREATAAGQTLSEYMGLDTGE